MISELCALRSLEKGVIRAQEGALLVYAVASVGSGGVYRTRIHRTGPSRLALV